MRYLLIPLAILIWLGIVLLVVWLTKGQPELLDLETIDPNDPVLETLVDAQWGISPNTPYIEWEFDTGEIARTVCEVNQDGVYKRGHHYQDLTCEDFRRIAIDPNDPYKRLATCWLMDQCSKECD